jgi:hypothetical protein
LHYQSEMFRLFVKLSKEIQVGFQDFKVQRKAVVWYEVNVFAEDASQAQELGDDALDKGEGREVEYTFEWVDSGRVERKSEKYWTVVKEWENA